MLDNRIYTFLEVCQTLNYTKAAQNLHITQPAVTQHIHYLEEEYHTRLFEMHGKKIQLTPQGQLLQKLSMSMNVENMQIHRALQESLIHKPKLTFGATLTIGEYLMPSVLKRFLTDHPDTDVDMTVKNTETLLSMLEQGEIDFAIVEGSFDKRSYHYKLISHENYIGVSSPELYHQKQEWNFDELFSQRLIVRELGSGTREILERYLSDLGHTVNDFSNLVNTSNLDAIKKMVQSNLGITFLYEIAARQEISQGLLYPLTIRHFHIVRDFHFVYLKNSIFSEKYDLFLSYF